MDAKNIPKILLITSSSFNGITGTGITLSNLFAGWPHQNLAVVHEDSYKNDSALCKNEYKLGSKEIAFRFPLPHSFGLKQNRPNLPSQKRPKLLNNSNGTLLKWRIENLMGSIELFRKKRLSAKLARWIEDFNPDLIYCHLSCLNDISFINQILSIRDVPLVVHIMDDFFQFQYKRGLFAPILRVKWNREIIKILGRAKKRICISEKMARSYENRYGFSFINYFNAVDTDRWLSYPHEKRAGSGKFDIVYAGTINSKNINNLIAMSRVIGDINNNGYYVKFSIYTFPERVEIFRKHFLNKPNVSIGSVPGGDDIIPLFKSADLLFLPVDFTKSSIERMKYSMFTKIPAYMISGTPILMYGPKGIASVDYALKYEWAYVVSSQSKEKLKDGLMRMIRNGDLRTSLSQRAVALAIEHHDTRKIRQAFWADICSTLTN